MFSNLVVDAAGRPRRSRGERTLQREAQELYRDAFPGMEFAGPTLFFGVLGLFERYTRYQAAFDSPHAHPNAYERLYRLRVYYASGDGHMYWALPGSDELQLARLDLEAHPEAVRFSDAVAKSLLSVLEQVEAAGVLGSPMNELFNRLASEEIDASRRQECWNEVCRWLYLGSPTRILQHLSEARNNVQTDLESSEQGEDRVFLERCSEFLRDVVSRAIALDDDSVKRAARPIDC